MKLSSILIPLLYFALGYCTHWGADRWLAGAAVASHWDAVNDHNAYMRNPSNYKTDAATGFVFADVPSAPEPHLAALVAAGELEHVDLVFPNVPRTREATQLWMRYVEEHRDTIIYALGNPEYIEYAPSGEQPLHLNLWFKDAAKPDVQRLIEKLEQLSKNH